MSWWSPPVLRRRSCYDFLASVSFVVSAMWPNMEIRRGWTIANRRGCPVVRLNSSFRRWWYHLIPNSFRKHHWSRASILSRSLLVTAQHSEPYRKIGRMQLLYNFSLVEMAILDFQIWLCRFWIAARVMALRREISDELWVVECTRELWTKLSLCQKHKWKVVIIRHLHHQNYACLPPTTETFTVNVKRAHHQDTRIEVPGTV